MIGHKLKEETKNTGGTGEQALTPGLKSHLFAWEIELLISGAVVFSLLQLPALMDNAFKYLLIHVSSDLAKFPTMLFVYFKSIVYILIYGFVLHIGSRGYWIALVGLNFVLPNGVKWEKIKLGPITKEKHRELLPSLDTNIESVDRFCSIIFSFCYMVVYMILYSVLLMVILFVPTYAVRSFLPHVDFFVVFMCFFAVIFLPVISAQLLDKLLAKRENLSERFKNTIGKMVAFYFKLSLSRILLPVQYVFFSNIKPVVMYSLMFICFAGPMCMVFGTIVFQSGPVMDSYIYFPDRMDKQGVHYKYYEHLRKPEQIFKTSPSIQSDMITDRYVKLFIPYSPKLDNPVLRRLCKDIEPVSKSGINLPFSSTHHDEDLLTANAGCLSRLYRVYLNNKLLKEPGFRFYKHPHHDIRGLVAYIPVEGLPAGANMLVVQRVAVREETGKEKKETAKIKRKKQDLSHYIPFWL
ncbi:MAG: hypothetical protein GY757_46120 [bacterium]|nr:hypothetical protein [bacterium]